MAAEALTLLLSFAFVVEIYILLEMSRLNRKILP